MQQAAKTIMFNLYFHKINSWLSFIASFLTGSTLLSYMNYVDGHINIFYQHRVCLISVITAGQWGLACLERFQWPNCKPVNVVRTKSAVFKSEGEFSLCVTLQSHFLWLSFNTHKIPLKSNSHIYSLGHLSVIYDVTVSLVPAAQDSLPPEKHSD